MNNHKNEIRTYPRDTRYAVSTEGSVYGPGLGRGRKQDGERRRLVLFEKNGYLRVTVGSKQRSVHEMVLETFSRPRSAGEICRHIDGNRLNNHAANLQWGTPAQNTADSIRHGTFASGEKCGTAKLTNAQAAEIDRRLQEGKSGVELAKEFNVSTSTISLIRRGKTWRQATERYGLVV